MSWRGSAIAPRPIRSQPPTALADRLAGDVLDDLLAWLEAARHVERLAQVVALEHVRGDVAAGEGFPVAILNRNAPAFYCVPAKVFEEMMERLEDLELNTLADARAGQPVVKVSLDDL